MYDMGVYPLNGARFLTGMDPIAITASHEKSHPEIFTQVDETTYFTLQFANGLSADCGTSVVKSFNHIRLECEQDWYELKPMSEYSGVTVKTSAGVSLPPMSGMQQRLQMDNDALAILGLGPILVSGEEGMKDIHVVENAFKSAQLGKRIVLQVMDCQKHGYGASELYTLKGPYSATSICCLDKLDQFNEERLY